MLSRFRFSSSATLSTSHLSFAPPSLLYSIRSRPTRIGGGVKAGVVVPAARKSSSSSSSSPVASSSSSSSTTAAAAAAAKSADLWTSVLPSVGSDISAERAKKQHQQQQQPADAFDEFKAEKKKAAESNDNQQRQEQHQQSSWAPLKSQEFLALLKGIKVSAGPSVSTPAHLLRVSQYDSDVVSQFAEPKDVLLLFHELANADKREQQMLAVAGQPGVGKSSIVPILLSALLEDNKRGEGREAPSSSSSSRSCIWMTQPTRAACIGLVQYMTKITGTRIGEEIGYGTGEGSNFNVHRTKIVICTPGYAAKYLSSRAVVASSSSSSPLPPRGRTSKHLGCHTMIIDEAHSVDEHLEVLLTVCALQLKESTAMVFMSATMDFPVLQRLFSVAHRSTARSLYISQNESFLRYVFQPNQVQHVLCNINKILPPRFVHERLLPSLVSVHDISAYRATGTDGRMVLLPNAVYRDLAELLMRLACSSEPRSGGRRPRSALRAARGRAGGSAIQKKKKKNVKPNQAQQEGDEKKEEEENEEEQQQQQEEDDSDVGSVLVFLPGFQEMQHLTGQIFRCFRAYTSVDSEGRGDVLYVSRFHVEAPKRFFSARPEDYEHDPRWVDKTGKLQREGEVGDEVVEIVLAHSSVIGNGTGGSTSFGFDMAGEYGETPWFSKGQRSAESGGGSGGSGQTDAGKAVVPGRKFRGRTIVLATNVAESSLTIPNLKFVVDLGLERFEQRSRSMANSSFLATRWISETSASQRAGRVGRTCDGFVLRCYPKDVLRREHVGVDTSRYNNEDIDAGGDSSSSSSTAVLAADDDEGRSTVLVAGGEEELAPLVIAGDSTTTESRKESIAAYLERKKFLNLDSNDLSGTYMIERLLLAAFALPTIARDYSLTDLRSCWIHRVSAAAVQAAMGRLVGDGLLVPEPGYKSGHRLTRAGLVVSHLPLPIAAARFVWYALVLGCVVDALLVTAVLPSPSDLFVVNHVRRVPDDREEGVPFQQRYNKKKREKEQQEQQSHPVEAGSSGRSVWEIEAVKAFDDSSPSAAAAASVLEQNDEAIDTVNDGDDEESSNSCKIEQKAVAVSAVETNSSSKKQDEGPTPFQRSREVMDPYMNAHLTRVECGIEQHLSDPWMFRQLIADWLSMPRRSMRRRQTGPASKIHFETRYLKPQTVFVDRVGVRSRRFDAIDASIIRCAKALDEALTVTPNSADEWRDELSQLRALQVLVRTGCAIGDKQLEAAEALFGPLPDRVHRGKDEPYDDEDLQKAVRRYYYTGRIGSSQSVRVNEELRRSRMLLAYAAAFGDKLVVGAPSEAQYQGLFSRSGSSASAMVQQQLMQQNKNQQHAHHHQHQQRQNSAAALSAAPPLPAMLSSKTDQSVLVVHTPNAVIAAEDDDGDYNNSGSSSISKKRKKFLQIPPDVFTNRFLANFVRGSLHDKMTVDMRGTVAFVSVSDQQQERDNKQQQQQQPLLTVGVRHDLNRPHQAVSFAPLETMRTQNMLSSDSGGQRKSVIQVPRDLFVEIPSGDEPLQQEQQEGDGASSPSSEPTTTTTAAAAVAAPEHLLEQMPSEDDAAWLVIHLNPPRRRVCTFPRSGASDDSYRCDREGGRWIAFRRSAVSNLGMTEEVEEIGKIASVLAPRLSLLDNDESQKQQKQQHVAEKKIIVVDDEDPEGLIVDDGVVVAETPSAKTELISMNSSNPSSSSRQAPPPFVALYSHPFDTHVLHHPHFYVLGRYTGDDTDRQLASSSHRFQTAQAMTLLGAMTNVSSNNNSTSGGRKHNDDDDVRKFDDSAESAADNGNAVSDEHRRRMLLKIVEEDAEGSGALAEDDDESSLPSPSAVHRSTVDDEREKDDENRIVGNLSKMRSNKISSSNDINNLASTVEASGLHVSRIKRQHCALCGKVVPRLTSVPGHRYSTRHLMRLCALLQLKIPLAEVCRIFSAEASSNVVAVSRAETTTTTTTASQQEGGGGDDDDDDEQASSKRRRHVIRPVPSSSFSATVHISNASHLSGMRFQPTFAGGPNSTRAGWNDGVLFGYTAIVTLPSPSMSLTRSGYIRSVWLMPPPSPQLQLPPSASPPPPSSSSSSDVATTTATTTSSSSLPPLVDDLMSSACIAGASSGNPVRLLVEATPTAVVSLVAVQSFPFPPMALREPAPLDNPAVAAFLAALAMCRHALRDVNDVADARRLRRLVFAFLGKNFAGGELFKNKKKRQQQQQQQSPVVVNIQRSGDVADADSSTTAVEPERFWIHFDPVRRDCSSNNNNANSGPSLEINVQMPNSVHNTNDSSNSNHHHQQQLLQSEARLLNAVLMALTADSVDGRITVDRVVRRFVQQQTIQAATVDDSSPSPSSFRPPAMLSNPAALDALDSLCYEKGYASVHEMLVLACGAVPLEAQLGCMSTPVGVDDRNVACGSLLLSRMMLPSRILTRAEALATIAQTK